MGMPPASDKGRDSYDYIVVGAGSAGAIIAARLSDAGASVLLLEAGSTDDAPEIRVPALFAKLQDTHLDWGYRTVAQAELAERRIFWPRGRVLGGSSSINYMVYLRGLPGDFDCWREMGNAGWGYEDVLPFFLRFEGNARLGAPFHNQEGPVIVTDQPAPSALSHAFVASAEAAGIPGIDDFNGADATGCGYFQRTAGQRGRSSTAVAYLHPAMARGSKLQIITHAQATRLRVEGKRVVGLDYLVKGEPRTAFAAEEVVLSAGAINSPQLLLLSGIGPAESLRALGIGVVCDLPGVGRNLQDHLVVRIGYETTEASPAALSGKERDEATQEFLTSGTGPLATNLVEAGARLRVGDEGDEPDVQMMFLVTSGEELRNGQLPSPHGASLDIFGLRPRSRGELRLATDDPLDPPLIDPRCLSDSRDLALTLRALRRGRQIMAQKPMSRYIKAETEPGPKAKDDTALTDNVRKKASTVYHPCGTCRMGGDAMAVVDARLKLHKLEGLRVADASVIPTIVSANINAACMMIGEKAADLILHDGRGVARFSSDAKTDA